MKKLLTIPSLLAISIALTACSQKPSPELEQAQAAYAALKSNPEAERYAPLETDNARKTLDKANNAFLNRDKWVNINQLAYLTDQQVQLAKETIILKSAEEQFAKLPLERERAIIENRDAEIRALKGKETERGTVVSFSDVLFDFNKSNLKAAGLADTATLAAYLNRETSRQVLIEGFTDSIGSQTYNLGLSQRRADAVRDELIRLGVSPARIKIRAYGKEYPVASNETAEGRALNRRVEIIISRDDQPVMPRSSMR